MKGPRSRHKFNVLRVWECPACKKREFAPARVASLACRCEGADRPRWMCLLEAKSAGPKAAEPKPD